jgi:hypothetical protein
MPCNGSWTRSSNALIDGTFWRRQYRTAITALLELLADLEDVSWSEGDRSVFHELAHLFDDVAEQARRGAEALRGIGRA